MKKIKKEIKKEYNTIYKYIVMINYYIHICHEIKKAIRNALLQEVRERPKKCLRSK